jgi:heme exporter protein C
LVFISHAVYNLLQGFCAWPSSICDSFLTNSIQLFTNFASRKHSTLATKPSFIATNWWKVTGAALVFYSLISGMLGEVPRLPILHETIRNLYYHVTMWFAMIFVLGASVFYSIRYLSKGSVYDDMKAEHLASAGILLGILGISTGSVWARFTWGGWWANDPKLNGAAISLLIYFAYVILRSSMDEEQKRARVAAVYNIFAFVLLIVFLMIYPRLNQVDSLHPGNGGNPAFSSYDLDSNMRKVFYPAVAGWIMMGLWIADLSFRVARLKYKRLLHDSETTL